MSKFDETSFGGPGEATETKPEQEVNGQHPEPKKITKEELDAVASAPALYASKFYLTMLEGAAIKITFADEHTPETAPCVRGAYVVTLNKFLELAQFVTAAANNIQQQMKQSEHIKNLMAANANKNRDREELN